MDAGDKFISVIMLGALTEEEVVKNLLNCWNCLENAFTEKFLKYRQKSKAAIFFKT